MKKGFMFIDENIVLDFPMSDELKECVDIMDKAFAENDTGAWDEYYDVIGLDAKTEHACGRITSDQMHAIWERYHTGG